MIAPNQLSPSVNPHDDPIPLPAPTVLAEPYLPDVSLTPPPSAALAETGLPEVALMESATPASSPARDFVQSRICQRLLHLADGYRARNAFHQAIEIYFELVECHAMAPEGRLACERLLEIGEWYEHHGEYRQARGIYERLG